MAGVRAGGGEGEKDSAMSEREVDSSAGEAVTLRDC